MAQGGLSGNKRIVPPSSTIRQKFALVRLAANGFLDHSEVLQVQILRLPRQFAISLVHKATACAKRL